MAMATSPVVVSRFTSPRGSPGYFLLEGFDLDSSATALTSRCPDPRYCSRSRPYILKFKSVYSPQDEDPMSTDQKPSHDAPLVYSGQRIASLLCLIFSHLCAQRLNQHGVSL